MAWMKSPLKIGSFVPSSRALARAVAKQIHYDQAGAVVELGAGTGVITNAILEAGLDAKRLIVIERDAGMHEILCAHFPQLTIIKGDACNLKALLAEHGIEQVNSIISSLPLLSMPNQLRIIIEEQMIGAIGEHGRIVQFTYGHRSPFVRNGLHKVKLNGRRVATILANIPPAHIWVFQKLGTILPQLHSCD